MYHIVGKICALKSHRQVRVGNGFATLILWFWLSHLNRDLFSPV